MQFDPGIGTVELVDDVGQLPPRVTGFDHRRRATMLHLPGIDHEKLNYFNNGGRYRLSDVA